MARNNEGHAIGIDFGTTYSRVAVWNEQRNRAEIIYNEASFVAFTDDTKLIGDSAKNQAASNPSNTVFGVKKFMGRKYSDPIIQNNLLSWPFGIISSKDDKPVILVNYNGKEKHLSPEEISSLIFKKMLDVAEAHLKSPIKNAVITMPVYFNDSQRKATKDAAVIAGINVVQIINEPVAAALSYGLYNKAVCAENRNIVIVDLGGGTFGVSLITFKDYKFEIKLVTKTRFGGEGFIDRMVKHFLKEFERKHKIDISRNSRALRRLRNECEEVRNKLSFDFDATIFIDALYDGIDFYSSMSRAKFEQLSIDLFDNFMDTIKICLSDAKINNSSVDEVVLVGGSSRDPKLQQLLQEFFKKGKHLFSIIDPDDIVACGAAIQSALLSGGLKNVPHEVNQYLTRLSLAQPEPEPIPRNIVNDKKVNVTIEDNKSKIMIDFQGGVGITVNAPGSFNVSLPDTALVLPINVCFATDSDGMLNVSAEVQSISKDIKITNENVRVEFRSPC